MGWPFAYLKAICLPLVVLPLFEIARDPNLATALVWWSLLDRLQFSIVFLKHIALQLEDSIPGVV